MEPREAFRTVPGSGPVSLGGYDHKAFSDQLRTDTGDQSPVQQSEANEVDINTIVRRFGISRNLPSGVPGGFYGDFTGISSFADAVAAIERARDGFMTLPPDVRERFDNDPGKLIAFAETVPESEFLENLGMAPVVEVNTTPPESPAP